MKYLVSFGTDWDFEIPVFNLCLKGYLNSLESSFIMTEKKLLPFLEELKKALDTVENHYFGTPVAEKNGKKFIYNDRVEGIIHFLSEVIKRIKEEQKEAKENGYPLHSVAVSYGNWEFRIDCADWQTV